LKERQRGGVGHGDSHAGLRHVSPARGGRVATSCDKGVGADIAAIAGQQVSHNNTLL
jgi:hypothetical protein